MREADFLYVNGRFWVCRATKGFEVYKDGFTHATRVAVIGYEGADGLDRAKAIADSRAHMDANRGGI